MVRDVGTKACLLFQELLEAGNGEISIIIEGMGYFGEGFLFVVFFFSG